MQSLRTALTLLICLLVVGCSAAGNDEPSRELLDGMWVTEPVSDIAGVAFTLDLQQSGEDVTGMARPGPPSSLDSTEWSVDGVVVDSAVTLTIVSPTEDTARYDGTVTESDSQPPVVGELRLNDVSQATYYLRRLNE
jgi:hypothetical protein